MDNLMIFSGLKILRIGFHEPPFWDEDLRALYASKLAQEPPAPGAHRRLALRPAGLLAGLAARNHRTMDEPVPRPWQARLVR